MDFETGAFEDPPSFIFNFGRFRIPIAFLGAIFEGLREGFDKGDDASLSPKAPILFFEYKLWTVKKGACVKQNKKGGVGHVCRVWILQSQNGQSKHV